MFDVSAMIAQFVVTDAVFFKIGLDVTYCGFRDVIQGFLRQKRLMGGHDDIRHGDQAGKEVVVQDVP